MAFRVAVDRPCVGKIMRVRPGKVRRSRSAKQIGWEEACPEAADYAVASGNYALDRIESPSPWNGGVSEMPVFPVDSTADRTQFRLPTRDVDHVMDRDRETTSEDAPLPTEDETVAFGYPRKPLIFE
jgi:hypothetical protein